MKETIENLVVLGLPGIVVPPTGKSVTYKVEERFGKSATVRRIRAENNPKICMTIGRTSGDGARVSNVALSLMTADKPLPVYLPEGDYTITFSSISSTDETVNLAFDTVLK